jgi:hypothetical protein
MDKALQVLHFCIDYGVYMVAGTIALIVVATWGIWGVKGLKVLVRWLWLAFLWFMHRGTAILLTCYLTWLFHDFAWEPTKHVESHMFLAGIIALAYYGAQSWAVTLPGVGAADKASSDTITSFLPIAPILVWFVVSLVLWLVSFQNWTGFSAFMLEVAVIYLLAIGLDIKVNTKVAYELRGRSFAANAPAQPDHSD